MLIQWLKTQLTTCLAIAKASIKTTESRISQKPDIWNLPTNNLHELFELPTTNRNNNDQMPWRQLLWKIWKSWLYCAKHSKMICLAHTPHKTLAIQRQIWPAIAWPLDNSNHGIEITVHFDTYFLQKKTILQREKTMQCIACPAVWKDLRSEVPAYLISKHSK